MEAVLSYVELLIALIRHTEHISLGRHCLVERRIEYYYLRSCFGDNLLAGSQRKCVCVVMYGSKVCKTVYLIYNLVRYDCCLCEYLSALHYSVTYSAYLAHILDNGGIALCHYLNQLFKSLCVSGERTFLYIFPAVKCLVSDLSVYTDTLAISLCYDRLILHIYKLILQ